MLYSEFLAGTFEPDNLWTHAEYKRIEKIYNDNESMTKEEAYKLYRRPDQLTQIMLDTIGDYKAEAISEKIAREAAEKKAKELQKELGEARQRILNLECQIRRYENAAHDLYYATRTI